MSDLSSVQGSVTLRKLRSGTTATLTIQSSKQLFQLYDDSGSDVVYAPDWETAAEGQYPIVKLDISLTQGTVSNLSVLWKINNTSATTIPGIEATADTDGKPILKIKANLAKSTILNFNSGTLTAEATFTDPSGHTQTVTKSEPIRIQKSVGSGYNVMINANKTYVDGTTSASNPTTLQAVIYRGTSLVSDPSADGIDFRWYNSTTASESTKLGDGQTYTISNPDDINGAQLYVCRAFVGSDEADAEAILITDRSDPFQITADAQPYKGNSAIGMPLQSNVTSVNVASESDNTLITFKVVKKDGTDYGSVKSWHVEKLHADTMKLIAQVLSGETVQPYTKDTETADTNYNTTEATNAATAEMYVYDADYESIGDGSVDRHNTEVIVTATATIQTT